ncbi:MAG TPA: HAMP domain-containing sensor histidine kinase [Steroidobacteraceae bacterium]|jgi:signal transduction histidine kinase
MTTAHASGAMETEVLRGSIRSRCDQAGFAFVAMIANTIFCILLLGRGVNGLLLAIWLLTATGLLLIRYVVAMQAAHSVDATWAVLQRFDRQFLAISIASQSITGAGIWIALGSNDEIASYVMTLLVCLYGTGTMVNLAHDYRSFLLSTPLLMGQPALYWLLRGVDGIAIAVILIGLGGLMIASVRNSQRTFDNNIKIRFEKDDLLVQLEHEKETALNALRQAEAANRSKSFFMAAASHDLRQPLYAASLLCDTLALHQLPAEPNRLLMQQRKALTVASGLFDNLLDLSRFESGTIASTVSSVNLVELLRQIEAEFVPLCAAKGLCLAIEPVECTVLSDYDLLDRMIRNLVGNAVRYTQQGEVRVCSHLDGEHMLLMVADTGPGIAQQDQERIFEEFVQLADPQHTLNTGVGLGLAIVRHIALLLNHEITVKSAPGCGTRMCVRLPRSDLSPAL